MNIVHNCDCMELMEELPENYFDLSITDPPYSVGASDGNFGRGGKGDRNHAPSKKRNLKNYANHNKRPGQEYFKQLFFVSKNVIVWGANYYPQFFTPSGWIVWDKVNTGPLSDGELAYHSFNNLVKICKLQWSGFIKKDGKHSKDLIHPNQKPVNLYKWLLTNYAKPGQTIFDSHVGSGSSRIACYDMAFDFVGCELDADYWQAQEERFQNHIKQADLFSPEERQEMIYKEKDMFS